MYIAGPDLKDNGFKEFEWILQTENREDVVLLYINISINILFFLQSYKKLDILHKNCKYSVPGNSAWLYHLNSANAQQSFDPCCLKLLVLCSDLF